jgi:hypothetical protein
MLLNLLLKLKMLWTGATKWHRLINSSKNPLEVQAGVLKQIIQAQSNTEFGRKHSFDKITDIESYRSNVAVQGYEDLRRYISRQQVSTEPALNSEPPVLYALTSGTTGDPKYVPITTTSLRNYRNSQQLVAYSIYRFYPDAYQGRILAITSAAVEGHLDNGTPFGSMSGVIYKSMPALMRNKYVVPVEVFEISDQDEKYFCIACHAVAEKHISMIATANPSTLLKLIKVVNQNFDRICATIAEEHPDRARSLNHLIAGQIAIRDLWPNLIVITTWTGGNCRLLIPEINKSISDSTNIIELGYLSSEFRGGIVIDTRNNLQIPCIHESFYEFVEQSKWEAGDSDFLCIDQLEIGQSYYTLVTTSGGLYRYDINDVIKVTGYFNRTPTFEFLQKGKGVINLTGEKLHEAQLVEAIGQLKAEHKTSFSFFMMLGDGNQLRYTLYIESAPIPHLKLDNVLSEQNIEFAAKLESGRLQATEVVFVKEGCGEAYKQYCLDLGQRENQFKLVHLQDISQFNFKFTHWIN